MPRSRRLVGFTLVELLVVMGIIAILVAMLLPVLARVQDAAQTTACRAKLQQIGHGFHLYGNTHKGALLPIAANGPMWADLLVMGKFVNARLYRQFDEPYSFNRAVAAEPFVADSIFRCPAGLPLSSYAAGGYSPSSPTDWHGASFARQQFVEVWYAANGYTGRSSPTSYNDFGTFPMRLHPASYNSGTTYLGPDTRIHKLTQMKRASELLLIADGFVTLAERPQNVNLRHVKRTKANILLGDGHVDSIGLKEIPTWSGQMMNDPAHPPPPYPRWRLDQR